MHSEGCNYGIEIDYNHVINSWLLEQHPNAMVGGKREAGGSYAAILHRPTPDRLMDDHQVASVH